MRCGADKARTARIYEAAVVSECLPEIIDDLAGLTKDTLGSPYAFNGGVTRWVGTTAAEKLIANYVALGSSCLK